MKFRRRSQSSSCGCQYATGKWSQSTNRRSEVLHGRTGSFDQIGIRWYKKNNSEAWHTAENTEKMCMADIQSAEELLFRTRRYQPYVIARK